jgi:formate-dependent nitrite reductase membrane component NrfD
MKPYLWMTDYTPQEEWIDRRGLLLWLAFFFSEIGAGMYLVSLFLEFWWGCKISLLISSILGGGLHLLYLGKPSRFWRMVLKPKSSELSRGTIIMILFFVIGAIHVAPSYSPFSGLPWRSDMLFFKVIMAILCFFVVTHGFVTMSGITAIPFWNSAVLPILSLASGIWIGVQLVIWASIGFSEKQILLSVEPLARWSLFAYAFVALCYFWSTFHSSSAGRESLKVVSKGNLYPVFYGGVVLAGFLIPIAITLYLWANDIIPDYRLAYWRIAFAITGDFTLRYVILKAGRYFPLLESNILLR